MDMQLLVIVWVLFLNVTNCQPIVETKYGRIQGEAIVLASGAIIDSYLGIPYAKAPIDDLRFQAPVEPEFWNDTFLATDLGDACMQSAISSIQVTHFGWTKFSEDCLNLNIYSPKKDSTDLVPVMVYIHGGGYSGGANIGFPGYFMAEKDVVMVAINYRLGTLGFAFTDDDTIPGNAGLLDQIQALKFIHENIASFGGDPDRVTVMGQSAGATSIGLLLVSPLAEGLFTGAILQSGSELAHWAVSQPDASVNKMFQVATSLDCPTDNNEEMVECLRGVSARRLVRVRFNCTTVTYCVGLIPVVDGTVLPDTPLNLRKSGQYNKVSEMIGVTEDDAFLFVPAINFPHTAVSGLNRSDFDEHLWEAISIASTGWPDPSRAEDVYEAFRFFYADWPYFNDPERNRLMLGRVYTDYYFGYAADLQAKLHSKENDVFFYIYDQRREEWKLPDWLGTFHATELAFQFGWPFLALEGNEIALNHSQFNPFRNKNMTDSDRIFSNFFMDLWTNFAKYGNPTPEPIVTPNLTEIAWPIFTEDKLSYMNLKMNPLIKENYMQKEYAFWTEYLNYIIYGQEFQGEYNTPDIDLGFPLTNMQDIKELDSFAYDDNEDFLYWDNTDEF